MESLQLTEAKKQLFALASDLLKPTGVTMKTPDPPLEKLEAQRGRPVQKPLSTVWRKGALTEGNYMV